MRKISFRAAERAGKNNNKDPIPDVRAHLLAFLAAAATD
jgi:hypothetical protein